MRYAIVESGGKQYRAVEGGTIEVDRLPSAVGSNLDLSPVLLISLDGEIEVGAPAVSNGVVKATVLDHFKGTKVTIFQYRPKKRIRVKTGHRQLYTRLKIDLVGRPGEVRKPEPAAPAVDKTAAIKKAAPARKAAPQKAAKADTASGAKPKAAAPRPSTGPAKSTAKTGGTKSTTTAKPAAKKTTTKTGEK